MTIAVIWQEDNLQWCAADTRVVVDPNNTIATEIAAKIYMIPVAVAALDGDRQPRAPHYRAQYGFVYAGAVTPASMTAITSSTFLQKLVREGSQVSPPTFEQIAELVRRLARRFMIERRMRGANGLFSAAFFGWCPHTTKYKIANIDGREEGGFRVELSYPDPPEADGDPWLVLGSGTRTFHSILSDYRSLEGGPIKRVPRYVIDKMVSEEKEPTVGGATSVAFAHQQRVELCPTFEMMSDAFANVADLVALSDRQERPAGRRPMFNGLDLETDVGPVGEYEVEFATTVL